jgi:hypothetical protein
LENIDIKPQLKRERNRKRLHSRNLEPDFDAALPIRLYESAISLFGHVVGYPSYYFLLAHCDGVRISHPSNERNVRMPGLGYLRRIRRFFLQIDVHFSPQAFKSDIYVGEVGVTNWKTSFPDTPMPPEVKAGRCLQKLEKV